MRKLDVTFQTAHTYTVTALRRSTVILQKTQSSA